MNSPIITKKLFKALLYSLTLMILLTNCAVIRPGQMGVLNRTLSDGIKTDKVYEDGFTWKWPWNEMIKYNIQLNSFHEDIKVLTVDELHTELTFSVILKPIHEELALLEQEIGKDYYQKIVRPEFISVSRAVIASYKYETLPAKSREIESKIYEELSNKLEGKHVKLEGVTLDHIMFSPLVTRATDEKLATKQKVEQKDFEIEVAKKDAEIQRIKAQGQSDAQTIIDQGLTTKYLQYKSLEVQENLTNSPNVTFYFVPTGKDGLPIIVDTSSQK